MCVGRKEIGKGRAPLEQLAHTVTVKILLLPPNARKERSSLDATAGFDLCRISFASIPVKTKYVYKVLIVEKTILSADLKVLTNGHFLCRNAINHFAARSITFMNTKLMSTFSEVLPRSFISDNQFMLSKYM